MKLIIIIIAASVAGCITRIEGCHRRRNCGCKSFRRHKNFLRRNIIINPMKNHRSLLASLLTIIIALIFTDTAQAGAGLAAAGAGPTVSADGGAPVTPAPVPSDPTPSSPVAQPPSMRAKLRISGVTRHDGCDELTFDAVCPPNFDPDGLSEDSTFSKWTPTANLKMSITHPSLIGRYNQGDTFYVDFSPVIPDEQCVKLCTADQPAEPAAPQQPADSSEPADPNDLVS